MAGRPELSSALRAIEGVTDAQAIGDSLAEPEAFAVLFDRHFDAVHGYAQRRVGPDLADEIAAETFTRAFDRRRRYDASREDARPWLLGIAANLLRRHWRSERRRLDAYARSAEFEAGGDLAPPVAAELAAALRALPRREREPLLLLAWADLSYEEIGVALGVPIGTVRSRISRGRARLRGPNLDSHRPQEAPNNG
ncbi:MAG: RNA polymerase sigma factor [Actinobacteria bacterium]|nr:MAG: RNA polymerase sigma factor [Actinomycetota bacterium]TMM35056.1 MAG: RNA polymerase sigma factor [Actinomycetota bacterium]